VSSEALNALLAAELEDPVPDGAVALASQLAGRGGDAVAAVLYYGSTLRAGSLAGILDFYVLVDRVAAWPGSALAHLANRVLPPNVGYVEAAHEGGVLRAKYAVMTPEQFRQRTTAASRDTTIWARFCQPARCVWARSRADRALAAELVAGAVIRAAWWAAHLGPVSATPGAYWRALFAHTYSAELRVEKDDRSADLVARDEQRYARLLPLAWSLAGIGHARHGDGSVEPLIPPAERQRAIRQWAKRARAGRRLNVLRLLKAAFTFDGAMDYVAWKIERHRGVRLEVRPWQRRHPLLAAPGLYLKLRRMGVLRPRAPGPHG
jgi:hypothetical protein